MSRGSRDAAVFWLLVALSVGPVVAEPCDSKINVPNKSFRRLTASSKPWNATLMNAYVWVDDIASRLFGPHREFEVYVLVGRIYPPFSSDTGKLNRDGFILLSMPDVNKVRSEPLVVVPGQRQVLEFSVGQGRFTLRVIEVHEDYLGDNESVDLQVCQE